VLVVDDNADMRDYVCRLLAGQYTILTAANGEEGLRIAQAKCPDLVLTDIMMPVLDGFALLRALRSEASTRTIPVIFLSARAGEEASIEGRDAGADDYLVKPFSARELLARVGAHLNMARMRKDADARLRESEERFRALVNASSDVVYRMSPDWSEMRQLDGRGFISDTFSPIPNWMDIYIDPDDRPGVLRAIDRAIQTKSTFELEHRVRRVDGTLGWTLSRAVPLFNKSGEIIEWFGAASDVTTRKEVEEALRTTEKLAAAGRLAATVAHEINNPLTSVTNLVYLAKRDVSEPKKVADYLQLAGRELDRVAHIARQTLGFYRDTSSPIRFNVTQTLDDLLFLYETRLESRKIKLIKQYDQDIEITALAGEIRQSLSNLIANAIDAMPSGGPLIIKVSRSRAWAGAKIPGVRVTILDTGSGISPQHMSKLFQPFFTTKAEVGTGLGLWITRNIIEKHGGTIHVKSRTGQTEHGTAFSIFLPLDFLLPEGKDIRSEPGVTTDASSNNATSGVVNA
jgi:signal transduction histidine kinase